VAVLDSVSAPGLTQDLAGGPRTSGDEKLDSLIQQAITHDTLTPATTSHVSASAKENILPPSVSPSSPAVDLSVRQKKTLSLDLGIDPFSSASSSSASLPSADGGGRESDSMPTKVAYVILQFNVVQDLRT